ncbi:proline dehydrogenase family protein [Aquimarina sp. D1M17]|uniref:proline dehydrogenase family protein n=1 Tax=Aquimarina acroporae TaxID=2937283 RepID=UPI0020BF150A|nr:proline dehydrogenase family protein [Aquimarina acroporae]MCK8520471.1 proline dehydrogenase family protein [Aquimarina acroporae]
MEHHLLSVGSEALRKAAMNDDAKNYILNNPTLFRVLKKAADRYIGGENLVETISKVLIQNENDFKCSIEYMGENTDTVQEASEATQEFIRIAKEIKNKKLDATISLDLSHVGLAISKDLCFENLSKICEEAEDIEVTISAEGIDRTDDVIHTYKKATKQFGNLSITMQAYLYRSKDDFKELLAEKGRIRIVKGAFETPKNQSIPRGKELDDIYLDYVDQLLAKNHQCSIATHHDVIQQEAKKLIDHYKPTHEMYEFESLYGIQTEQLTTLKKEGYNTKLYFVYGEEWYLYLCNRIAEYPLNLFRALSDIVN